MTEIQLFRPGAAFNESYKKSRANTLAGMAFNSQGAERQSALGQLAGLNPVAAQVMKKDLDEQDRVEIGEAAAMLNAAPPEMREPMFQRVASKFAPRLQALGGTMPATYAEAEPFIRQIAQAHGGGGATKVHSQYMGDDGNMRVIMSDGSEKAMGRYSPKYTPHYGADGSVSGYNPRTNELATTTVPNGAPPESGATSESAAKQLQAIYDRLAPVMGAEKAEEMAFTVLRESGVLAPAAQQAKVSVAPQGAMTQYQSEKLAMDKAKAAQDSADRKAKIDNAERLKGEAGRKRNEAVVMSVDDTLGTIDRLEKHPGYKALGTSWGDVQINTPIIRNDAKDANETLKTLAGQIALSTMANLKTLSSAGATGFGALTAPELKLLQNSIATLQQENISNAQIASSVKVIKEKMQKIRSGALGVQESQPAASPKKAGRFIIEEN
jgi:hypothetical protein